MKRIEQNEYAQFFAGRTAQQRDPMQGDTQRALGAFPMIHKVLTTAQLDEGTVKSDYTNGDSVKAWLKKAKSIHFLRRNGKHLRCEHRRARFQNRASHRKQSGADGELRQVKQKA